MFSFLGGVLVLILGFIFYSKFVEKQLDVDKNRQTPAYSVNDGVDFIPMATWKAYLVQFLNIAGLGPVFGALMGALYGPVAFLWVIFGCILGGAVHDYVSGMISLEHRGISLSEIYGIYLGKNVQRVMRFLTIFFSIIVGVVFVSGPAALLAQIVPGSFGIKFWIGIIFIYYFIATILPIDVVIGNLYPVFGICLVVMALGVGGGIVCGGYNIPEIQLMNFHPKGVSMWPMMFVTIACGAISGFHATQSPMIARCLKNEKHGRHVFYGAMITEGIVGLIWVAAGLAFYNGVPGLESVLDKGGAAAAVFQITRGLLGSVGGFLAILGVVVCPITTGDTVFRGARLMLADILNYPQKSIKNRLVLAVPMFVVGVFLTFVKFPILWRYMGWLTQAFAMMTLWACSVYIYKKGKNYFIAIIPATFMTAVSVSYILQAPEGFRLSALFSNVVGIIVAVLFDLLFYKRVGKSNIKSCSLVNKI
ncbi:carbon starvation protein A [Clostridium botulinum D/C]|uniref:carbon starvation CstA family protein n=1 Tax=Clostridium botulinum TaxID=1491 RepID=UPI001E373500|nr:carbon starvation CstA family protein [Clostridium botulinum]MCD3350266.1 carbon starvation protein A [Clostridium botulinum D/C]MCD3359286.1 carbon starvation protein A [Clostridium botulinum D/C]MCD3362939.1 carbon starvation protein A [Clostridium botulinum D/C]MCD3365065.1 carbon starvation protein A [Clostridium botulinum D/C]